MEGLQIERILRLDRNETHVLSFHGLGDRFSVAVIVLVGLHEGSHKLGGKQAHLVPLFAQGSSQKMRYHSCLHPDQ